MKILFLSLINFETFSERNIYSDLLRRFIQDGHTVYCVSPIEKRYGQDTHMVQEDENKILRLNIGNIQKTNLIEKGISTLLIEPLFIKGIKKYFSDVKFDLVLYATPPITFANVIRFVKKRDKAVSYLMLKDIWPQSLFDLGVLKEHTITGKVIGAFFRRKEKRLYKVSDKIGCMSPANCRYVLEHNPEIPQDKVELCPNSIEPLDLRLNEEQRKAYREKYGIPLDKRVFVYGGNLGRPQDVPFIVACLKACANISNVYFVIAGSGTDRHYLEEYMEQENPKHVKLFGQLLKNEYDKMIACCDVGLIFLDYRFTIPNFPSRLLSYMQVGLPVLACTDVNTDIGEVIVNDGFGWWCESLSAENVSKVILEIVNKDSKTLLQMSYMSEKNICKYSVDKVAYDILGHMEREIINESHVYNG